MEKKQLKPYFTEERTLSRKLLSYQTQAMFLCLLSNGVMIRESRSSCCRFGAKKISLLNLT